MSTHSLSSLLSVVVVLVALASSSFAQNSPNDYVSAHNDARSQVGVGPISWNDTLVDYAQNYANIRANDCALEHSGGPYGENIAEGGGYGYDFSGLDAVNMWVAEKQYYDYDSNSCAPGQMCGHYTQVVWADSTQLGCGRSQCYNGDYFIVCSYYPPGNYNGERPY
ncbi:Pathogenesis-related leaf protein 4-like protein [Drosera capensis]